MRASTLTALMLTLGTVTLWGGATTRAAEAAATVAKAGSGTELTNASEAQVRELLDVMQTRKLLDQVAAQLEPTLKRSMEAATGGKTLSPQQQQVLEDYRGKMAALLHEQLNWAELSPMFIKIYREHFSAAEILGMLKFYRSPVGQSMVAKLPAVMQQSNELMLERMSKSLFPKLQELAAGLATQMQAADAAAPAPPAATSSGASAPATH